MTEPRFILHHYESSPYAEKIRLLFGRGQQSWGSVLSPAMPPRPNVDPLTGGYRRIPIAQVGADIFCDTAIIAQEIALQSPISGLSADSVPNEVAELVQRAEGDVFFSAITSVKPLKLMGKMLTLFGPFGMMRFIKDRRQMMKGGSVRPPQGERAVAIFDGFLADLDKALTSRAFLSGDEPAYADFAVYHPIWLKARVGGGAISKQYPHVRRWFDRIPEVGHGAREELQAVHAFAEARANEPRPLPASEEGAELLNCRVTVAPEDYGREPVQGLLVAQTSERFIVARETDEFGVLHVHFPRQGYVVVKV